MREGLRHEGSADGGTGLPSRAHVLGCTLDRVDMERAMAVIEKSIADRRFCQHAAVNAAKLVAMRDDDDLRRAVCDATLVTADGQSVVWASRLLGQRLPTRVAGIDLMHRTIEMAEDRGYA